MVSYDTLKRPWIPEGSNPEPFWCQATVQMQCLVCFFWTPRPCWTRWPSHIQVFHFMWCCCSTILFRVRTAVFLEFNFKNPMLESGNLWTQLLNHLGCVAPTCLRLNICSREFKPELRFKRKEQIVYVRQCESRLSGCAATARHRTVPVPVVRSANRWPSTGWSRREDFQ